MILMRMTSCSARKIARLQEANYAYMESLVAPILAVLVSLGCTKLTSRRSQIEIEVLQNKVAQVETQLTTMDNQAAVRTLATLQPVTSAIKQLQETVGIR